jgi:hypothetical protein
MTYPGYYGDETDYLKCVANSDHEISADAWADAGCVNDCAEDWYYVE